MKIGIDARFFGPHEKGLGRYTEKLISHLQEIDSTNSYVCFFQSRDFSTVTFHNPHWSKALANVRWYTLAEQLRMPKLIRDEKVDLMLFPHYNVPVMVRVPFIVTIHDLILHHFPTRRASTLEPVKQAIKMAGYHWVISRAVRRAKRVITISQFTKNDLVKTFRLPEEKIAVTYESAERTIQSPQNDLAFYGITPPYFLYVGNAYPHKNLEFLIQGFQRFRVKHPDYSLVLVGKKDFFYDRLQREMSAVGLTDHVVFPGFVPDGDLSVLYAHALGYVFPSHYEGFGLPPLEAMLYDVPVISSRSSSMPEILEDAAEYFSPENADEFVTALDRVASDASLRENLIEKGRSQVQKYSWRRCAQETFDVIQSIVL